MNSNSIKYIQIFLLLLPFSNGLKISSIEKSTNENSKEFWLDNAKKFVDKKINAELNTSKAKNIILFLGDGLGFSTIAATRVVLGGEEKKLAFENFPNTATAKTYCLDESVPDSACATNAFLRGFKGNYGKDLTFNKLSWTKLTVKKRI